MEDQELGAKIKTLDSEINQNAHLRLQSINQLNSAKDDAERQRYMGDFAKYTGLRDAKQREKDDLIRINNADDKEPQLFYLRAPDFRTQRVVKGQRYWTVFDPDFREKLTNQAVRPSDPILHLGDKDGPWEIELKIPQKHIGQVLRAFQKSDTPDRLDVDFLLTSRSTHTYRGILYRNKISGEATPNRDDHNESAPVVIAYVSLNDPSIPEDMRVPREDFINGVDVHTKVRCGNRAMGYSLFYGLWEFFYEKVVFFF
jgi:hypothetical protein